MRSSLGEFEDVMPESNDPIKPFVDTAMETVLDRSLTVFQVREIFNRQFSAAYMQGMLAQADHQARDRKKVSEEELRKPHRL